MTDESDRIAALEEENAQLRRERNLFHALLDSQSIYSYIRDTDLRYIFSNKAHRKMMGATSLEDVVGKKDTDFFAMEDAVLFEADDRRVLEQGESLINHEEQAQMDNGHVVWHLTNKHPARNEEGIIIGLVGTTRDITEEKHQQAVIKAQQNVLREVGTPIIPVAEGVVILPLIGDVDSHRAVDIMRATLAGISQHQADVIIIDITGVPVVDTGVAAYFNRTIQAVKLKGARAIITGISENVAEAIVDLGIDWSQVDTMPDLKSALQLVLHNRQSPSTQ